MVVRVSTREKGYIFARDLETEEEYFVHISGVAPEVWPTLDLGEAVVCRVAETSKGLRAYDVVRGDDALQAQADAVNDHRGNR